MTLLIKSSTDLANIIHIIYKCWWGIFECRVAEPSILVGATQNSRKVGAGTRFGERSQPEPDLSKGRNRRCSQKFKVIKLFIHRGAHHNFKMKPEPFKKNHRSRSRCSKIFGTGWSHFLKFPEPEPFYFCNRSRFHTKSGRLRNPVLYNTPCFKESKV